MVLLLIGGGISLTTLVITWFNRRYALKAVARLGTTPFFLGCFAQIAYYKLSGSVGQRYWYWVIQAVFMVLILGILLEILRRGIGKLSYAVNPRLTWGLVVLASLSLLFYHADYLRQHFGLGYYVDSHTYLEKVSWMEENVQPGARIGLTGAGTLAYFLEGYTIVNLDGLVNSYEYFQHLRSGTVAEFLADENVDYVFGSPYILQESNPYAPMFAGRLEFVAQYPAEELENYLWRFVP